jgi:hypothetical protein
MGRAKIMVRRKNRRRIFQNDSTPVTKINFVKKTGVNSVNRRTTTAGNINRMPFNNAFRDEIITWANLSLLTIDPMFSLCTSRIIINSFHNGMSSCQVPFVSDRKTGKTAITREKEVLKNSRVIA